MAKRSNKVMQIITAMPLEYDGRGKKPSFIIRRHRAENHIWTFVIDQNRLSEFQVWHKAMHNKYYNK